ncbi:MAG: SdrD B-like domain-containing protein [Candidatus Spechtbacterales bacterium]|nr:SdrD B-like domain-containing protein [Candidatus Spechtbacterales bacterium]
MKKTTKISILIIFGAVIFLPALSVDAQTGTYDISGVVWHDANKDRIQIRYESLMQGWTITLEGPVNMNTLTEYKGVYSFTGLTPGTYKVCQTPEINWVQSYPAEDNCHNITITNSDVNNVNFGVYKVEGSVLGASTTGDSGSTGGTSTNGATSSDNGSTSGTSSDSDGEVLGETGASPMTVFSIVLGFIMLIIGFIGLRNTLKSELDY